MKAISIVLVALRMLMIVHTLCFLGETRKHVRGVRTCVHVDFKVWFALRRPGAESGEI